MNLAPSQTLRWRERTIAWHRIGAGPPVVLLHGTPWSSALWRPIAYALAGRYTVHLWDMPGFGASSKRADHAVDLGVQAELFASLLRVWGLERPHVVAHDVGAAVALRAGLLHGAAYSSLCLVDAVALRPWGSPFFRLVREHADVFAQLPAAVHRGAVEAYIRTASSGGLRERDLAMLVEPWTGEDGQPAFYRQIAQADEAHTDAIEAHLSRIDAPTHLVWGRDDAWVPVDRAHALQRRIRGATLAVIPDAGHLVQLDAPAAVASELTDWLSRVS